MLKISRSISVYISIALTVIMFAGVVVLAFYAPSFIDALLSVSDVPEAFLSLAPTSRTHLFIAAYAEIALMITGLSMLFALLVLVQRKKVFTAAAVELIRYISWCLVLMGVIMLTLSFCSSVALFVGAAVFFVGLTIRVVKNVIEEAVYLKEENDLTV